MIYLDTSYSEDLTTRYENFCLQYIRPKLASIFGEINNDLFNKFYLYFDDACIRRIVSSEAYALEILFKEIFEEFPILAERFNPKFFFRNLKVNNKCDELDLRTKVGKEAIKIIKRDVLDTIEGFLSDKPSILLEEFVGSLNNATREIEIKNQLTKLGSIINGTVQSKEYFLEKFPNWLEEFSDAFNYDYVIDHFGVEIVNSIDLLYCPYCADESIESFVGFRPAIDHYYPKSKFPFLALSLHNFVPAGDRCNSRFKRNNEMTGCFNPALDKLPNAPLFYFEYPLGRSFSEDEIKVAVNNVSEQIYENVIMFKLEDVYNKFEIRKEFKNLYDRINLLEGLGQEEWLSDPQKTRIFFNVDLTLSQKKIRYQKFLVDSLNFLADCNLVVNSGK